MFGATACTDAFGPRPRPTGILPDSVTPDATLLWYEMLPRVVTIGQTDSVRFNVAVDGTPRTVNIELKTGPVHLARQPNGIFSARVAVADLLFGYRTGDLHNSVALLQVNDSATFSEQRTILVNVKDGGVPTVTPQILAPNSVQATSHIVNIRYDSLYLGGQVPAQVLRTFYQHFGDDYDFVSVVGQVHSDDELIYFAARNNITGLGLQVFDRAEAFGSTARLQGILNVPHDGFFDLADTNVLHELGHRWMNFGNLQSTRVARPEWPISTLAYGITGFIDPATASPLIFRFLLTRQANGTYSVTTQQDRPRTFNDFELYLMGLLPPDSVAPHIVFLNQDQRGQLRNGGTLSGPLDTVTVAKWVARDGVRDPSYANSQRDFKMASIVLSRGGLLSRDEMSFFNHMAARGEAEANLPIISGSTRLQTLPFFGATGGRGTLTTRLRLN